MYIILKTSLIFILVVVCSWVFLHLLSLLGIFLVVAYPIWWFLLPTFTPCIGCNALGAGKTCPFCRTPISKTNINVKSIHSAFGNSLVILFFTLLSIGIVFIESRVLLYFGIPATEKSVSIVIPPKGQYRLGEIFPIPIEIIGIKTPINAVQTDLSFDPRKLQVKEISTTDSFANIFIQKDLNNETGYARLTGGLPNPGFFADHGLFGTIYFQGLEAGITTIHYLPTSMILANDGRGTNVLKDSGDINILITPEAISSQQKKDQETLFNTNVLGESTSATQLLLYPAVDHSVLGESTATTVSPPPVTPNPFLNTLCKLNQFILSFWDNVGKLLTRPFTSR